MGASRWEASSDIRRSAVRLAMTPTLNAMNVMGVVSIPGMMTGQILGGTAPAQARAALQLPRHRARSGPSKWRLSQCLRVQAAEHAAGNRGQGCVRPGH